MSFQIMRLRVHVLIKYKVFGSTVMRQDNFVRNVQVLNVFEFRWIKFFKDGHFAVPFAWKWSDFWPIDISLINRRHCWSFRRLIMWSFEAWWKHRGSQKVWILIIKFWFHLLLLNRIVWGKLMKLIKLEKKHVKN